jgi:nodulation protein E
VNRVVITGLGAITPAGLDAPSSWKKILSGESAIGPIVDLPLDLLTIGIAAQIPNFRAEAYFPPRRIGTMDRVSQLAAAAAREAVADAGLVLSPALAARAAVIIGVAVGGMITLDESFHSIYAQGKKRVHPLTIPRLMSSAPASQIAMELGLHGPAFTVASACASGTHAIGMAFQAVRSGQTDLAITGGAEACVTVGTLLAWEAMRVLAADTCRPFSADRGGLVLGEGTAILVLEARDAALARGARIYAEITGFAASADAGDLTAPDRGTIGRTMRLAMEDAGMAAQDCGYINAHGTGTALNDETEAGAISDVFEARPPPVSSIKGVVGHSLGAAGAIEAMATALALHDQILPPTANYRVPDPMIALDVVPNVARPASFAHALSNSFAFGGLNAVLALRRHDAHG